MNIPSALLWGCVPPKCMCHHKCKGTDVDCSTQMMMAIFVDKTRHICNILFMDFRKYSEGIKLITPNKWKAT